MGLNTTILMQNLLFKEKQVMIYVESMVYMLLKVKKLIKKMLLLEIEQIIIITIVAKWS